MSLTETSCCMFLLLGYDSKQQRQIKQRQDFNWSLHSSCHMCCLHDQCQFNSTAVSEEVYSEPAINCVWLLRSGVVNLSLEYLVLVEVCIQNILLFLFDLFQPNKKKPHHVDVEQHMPRNKLGLLLSEKFLCTISWISWFRIVLSSIYWHCLICTIYQLGKTDTA